MIDRDGGFYCLVCDVCGEEAPETFDDFYEAVAYKKAKGWRSQCVDGEWEDVCPNCQVGQMLTLLVGVMLTTTILSALVGLFRAAVG
jgi:hypothetical protein